MLTQQQEEFDKAITGQITAQEALDFSCRIPARVVGRWRLYRLILKHQSPGSCSGSDILQNSLGQILNGRNKIERTGGFGAWLLDPKRRGALLVTPAIVILFVMNIFPLLWSFGLSFFNYKASSLKVPTFRGLSNYERVLTDEKVWERFSDHRYYCRFIGHSATYYWFSSCFDVCQSISHAKNSFDACSIPP